MTAAQPKPQLVASHPAIDYLESTFRDGDHISFFAVHASRKHLNEKTGQQDADTKTFPLMPLADAVGPKNIARLEKYDGEGWNIYVSMNPFPAGTTARRESLIETVRNVFIETDGEFDSLAAIHLAVEDDIIPAPHSILQSSPGKFHIVWHVEGFAPEEAKALNRALASRFGGDIACVDLHRLLRMPGFRNQKPKYPDKPVCALVEPMLGDSPYTRADFKVETVTLKPNGDPVEDEVLSRIVTTLEANAAEANFPLGPREKDFHGFRWDVICPWHETHTQGGKDAIVMVLRDGRPQFSCLHHHCAQRGWSDVRRIWETAAGHRQKFAVAKEEERFAVEGGELCAVHWQEKGRGDAKEWVRTLEPLANFSAAITKHIVLDDGVATTMAHIVGGVHRTGKKLPEVRMLAKDFPSMNWVPEHWTIRGASLRPGLGVKDRLRAGIEFLSEDPPIEHIYTHTGWVKLESGWEFLHAAGSLYDRARVDLGAPNLERYRLPNPASKDANPAKAMRASLSLLDVAPDSVTVPLWSAMFRAPLASHLPLNVTIWEDATTGNLKTTIATLFLCHFGEFDVNHTPANWSSTANALEHQAFLLQDMPLLIDEFVPTSVRDVRELEAKAARLIRSQGNLTGRGRMDSNLKQRQSFTPRGMILSTGEGRPPGESLQARSIVLEPRRNTVKLDKLTEAQKVSGLLPHAMSGYLAWIAPQLDKLPAELLKMQREGRSKLFRDTSHLRVPETVASIGIGAELALRYAVETKTISEKRADELRGRVEEAFIGTVIDHADRVREENPSRRFLRVLLSALDSGQALMWHKSSDKFPPMDVVGWYDDFYLYLLPETAQKTISEFCQKQGEPFTTRERVVREQLSELGVLERDQGGFTRVVMLGGKLRRVLQLRRDSAEALADGGKFPDDPPEMMKR